MPWKEVAMRKSGLVKVVALFLAASLGTVFSGCYGKYHLTRKLNEINGSLEDPYVRSVVAWAFVIPYGFASILDFTIFNVIEFWSGENPLTETPPPQSKSMGSGKAVMTISREGEATVATIAMYREGTLVSTLRIRDEAKGTVTSELSVPGGETVRYVATRLPDGSIVATGRSASWSRTERHPQSRVETVRARVMRIAGDPGTARGGRSRTDRASRPASYPDDRG
jgi:hypothetical protein